MTWQSRRLQAGLIDVVYLAAWYSRHAEMRRYRDDLQARGIHVSSRWIDQHGGNLLESFDVEQLNADPEHCAQYAKANLDDLAAADTVISFTGPGRGGRHWEAGWAHAAGKQQILIGPREHVFHTLIPAVYPDWGALLAWLDIGRPV
jgi:hypothetical protein